MSESAVLEDKRLISIRSRPLIVAEGGRPGVELVDAALEECIRRLEAQQRIHLPQWAHYLC
jgi:hypothetical protein